LHVERRVVVGNPDQEGGRLVDLAPERDQIGARVEHARGEDADPGRLDAWAFVRAGEARGELAEDGHAEEEAGELGSAGVVAAWREDRVVDVGAENRRGRVRLAVRVDQRLLLLGERTELDGLAELAGGDLEDLLGAGRRVLQGRAFQLVCLLVRGLKRAGDELLEFRQQDLLLEATQQLVEDEVPLVVGDISRHEHGPARVVVALVGELEELVVGWNDDEAVLLERRGHARFLQLALQRRNDLDVRQRARRSQPRVDRAIRVE